MDVRDAESDVVHYAEFALVGIGGDVKHIFDPVGAVGDLHVHPISLHVLHTSLPVEAKAEDVFVKMVHGSAVVDDEAGVDEVKAIRLWRRIAWFADGNSRALNEGDSITFRICDGKRWAVVGFRLENADTFSLQILAHFFCALGGKSDFGEEAAWRVADRLGYEYRLCKRRMGGERIHYFLLAHDACQRWINRMGVEGACSGEICRIEVNRCDAEDFRTFLSEERWCERNCKKEEEADSSLRSE